MRVLGGIFWAVLVCAVTISKILLAGDDAPANIVCYADQKGQSIDALTLEGQSLSSLPISGAFSDDVPLGAEIHLYHATIDTNDVNELKLDWIRSKIFEQTTKVSVLELVRRDADFLLFQEIWDRLGFKIEIRSDGKILYLERRPMIIAKEFKCMWSDGMIDKNRL